MRKQANIILRLQRNEAKAENLINMFMMIADRKNVLIKDYDVLCDKMFDDASADQQKKIKALSHLKKKIDSKNDDLRNAILDY